MKTIPLTLLLLSLSAAGKLSAQSPSWTSNDGRSIEARFLGVGPSSVLIEKDDATFIVPFSRLSTESVAQARTLGGLQDATVGTNPRESSPLPVPGKAGTAAAKKFPGVATATRASAIVPQLCGLRLDTGGRGGIGGSGPRWSPYPRFGSDWTVRHPSGFLALPGSQPYA